MKIFNELCIWYWCVILNEYEFQWYICLVFFFLVRGKGKCMYLAFEYIVVGINVYVSDLDFVILVSVSVESQVDMKFWLEWGIKKELISFDFEVLNSRNLNIVVVIYVKFYWVIGSSCIQVVQIFICKFGENKGYS